MNLKKIVLPVVCVVSLLSSTKSESFLASGFLATLATYVTIGCLKMVSPSLTLGGMAKLHEEATGKAFTFRDLNRRLNENGRESLSLPFSDDMEVEDVVNPVLITSVLGSIFFGVVSACLWQRCLDSLKKFCTKKEDNNQRKRNQTVKVEPKAESC